MSSLRALQVFTIEWLRVPKYIETPDRFRDQDQIIDQDGRAGAACSRESRPMIAPFRRSDHNGAQRSSVSARVWSHREWMLATAFDELFNESSVKDDELRLMFFLLPSAIASISADRTHFEYSLRIQRERDFQRLYEQSRGG